MAYRTVLIATSPQPLVIGAPLVGGSQDTFTVANTDITNSVWISTNHAVKPNDSDAIAIPPLGSAPIPASIDTYAVSAVATGVSVLVIPGSGGWSPSPAQIAAQMNTLGLAKDATVTGVAKDATLTNGNQLTGFVSAPISLYTKNGQQTGVMAAGATVVITPDSPSPVAGYALVNELSYDIYVDFINASATLAAFIQLDIIFYDEDSLSAPPVDQMTWFCPVATTTGNSIPCSVYGHGPLRGVYCKMQLTNQTSGANMAYNLRMKGTGRQYMLDVWREFASNPATTGQVSNVNGYTRPGTTLNTGTLAWFNFGTSTTPVSIAAGVTVARLLPLYGGKARLMLDGFNLTADRLQIDFYPQNVLTNQGAGSATPFFETFLGSTTTRNILELNFPRDCVNMRLHNNDPSVTAQFWATGIVEEY